jgi:acetylornithine deacetylase/succinyl-diaminopimelate desuccinylase-like protein
VSALPLAFPERLAALLRDLCALATDSARPDNLCAAADLIEKLLHGVGMTVQRSDQAGIPLLIAQRSGRSARTLLLYHHYDTAPAGPWRAWSHEPFALAERDAALFARGVVDGKGPLIAHLQALEALIAADGDLPCSVVFVIEGAAHQGSPHLAAALAAHSAVLAADGVLGSVGERTGSGTPLCYSGSKGLLQVRLSARGAPHPISPGFAPTVRNPLWRLIWALGQIKGEDEDIRIPGFYDAVEGPTREETAQLRQITLDEAGRLLAIGGEFLFGLRGAAIVRAETTLPTCNIGALVCEPALDHAQIPAAATARLDVQLVPNQAPEPVFSLLRQHLDATGFNDIQLELLPGGYAPLRTPPDNPFVQAASAAGRAVYGVALPTVPAGSFALPLHTLHTISAAPAATIGLRRATSSLLGPDEHAPLDDLIRHGQILIELLRNLAELA